MSGLTYVTIDINPSIELVIDENLMVIEANSFNDDGAILLTDLTIQNLTVEEAIDEIVTSATNIGYIDEFSFDNDIEIVVYTDNDNEQDKIEAIIQEDFNEAIEDNNVPVVVKLNGITDEIKQEADIINEIKNEAKARAEERQEEFHNNNKKNKKLLLLNFKKYTY